MRITLKRIFAVGVYFLGIFAFTLFISRNSSLDSYSLDIPEKLSNSTFIRNSKLYSEICTLLGSNFSRSFVSNLSICFPNASLHYFLSHGIESDLRLSTPGCAERFYPQQTFQSLASNDLASNDLARSTIFSAYSDHRLKFAVRIIALVNMVNFRNLNCLLLYGTVVKSSGNDANIQIDQYIIVPAIFTQLPEWKYRTYVLHRFIIVELNKNFLKITISS